jgi:FkbM family methyltransferase
MGFSIRRTKELNATEALSRFGLHLRFLSEAPKTSDISVSEAWGITAASKSQLGQDVLALSRVGLAEPGFFVEFGATNGVELSNTFLLEKGFGWQGILCEPARSWHEDLKRVRDCAIDNRCVYSSSGETISFSETDVGELSTISRFMNSDANKVLRKPFATYQVETVSLTDLLKTHDAPKYIDFLSIDTEGSEFEILKPFDFEQYSFGLICVEHNFASSRLKIRTLLTSHGYSQIYPELSAFDDWYIFDQGK